MSDLTRSHEDLLADDDNRNALGKLIDLADALSDPSGRVSYAAIKNEFEPLIPDVAWLDWALQVLEHAGGVVGDRDAGYLPTEKGRLAFQALPPRA